MKMKTVLALLLIVAMVAALSFTMVACVNEDGYNALDMPAYENIVTPDYSSLTFDADFKVGLICLHPETSTYDKNFIDAMKETQAAFGLTDEQVIIVTDIGEDDSCYQKACELADAGCDIIFADSFGHEEYMIKAAKEYPNVQFCHATGTKAHTENLANYGNAFASIYEGRYLAGIAAGKKLNEMIAAGDFSEEEAKMGYVGAFPYAEVVSGYTSFYLGAKSVCPTVTMEVVYTGSWYDVTKENNSAKALINRDCKLISQHADSMGAPNACEEAGVPNVSYNGATGADCPNTFIISSRINWAPYYQYAIAQKVQNKSVAKDWTGSIKTGSVVLTKVGGDAAAEGTVEAIVAARTKLANGTLDVFDTDNFTVNGVKLAQYFADVDDFGDFVSDTQVIEGGVFKESDERSAPYFDLRIDGITELTLTA